MPAQQIEKEQLFNYALLFSIVKSAITRTIDCNTNKTDKIVFNSLHKAIEQHNASKREND